MGGVERLEPRQLLAVLYWDPDRIATNNVVSSGAGLGGSGAWTEAGAAVWFNPTLNGGAGGHVSWNSSLGDTAVFAGPTGGTVTISGGVGAAAVEFRVADYVVTGGSFTTATGGTTFTATVAGRFDTTITGTGGIAKTGTASLTLGAAVNTYTGTTLVSAGLLDIRGTIHSHVSVSGGTVQGVMFYDPDLAAAVREALGVDPTAWLTPALLAQSPPLTSLTVNGNFVGDLTGIASLSALTTLDVIPGDYAATAPGISSLSPLAGLTSLASLSLHDVGLTDAVFTTLPSLPGLTRLDVRYNALSVVPAAVAGLPRLGTLLVHGNPLLTGNPRAGLAALKGKAIDVDVAPDRPDTAASIADLAARLYFLPLKMLEYVTNTIVFQPYAGAMKGPLATLQTKAGNDWDTNSLLAALYGEAGISTRYVTGAIEVTESQLNDYVGTRNSIAAANILAAAGAGYDEFANRFKHTWLDASLHVPATGQQAWVPIDASWKLRDYRLGLPGMLASVPFSPLEADYLTNPAWRKRSAAEYYEAKVAAWLAQNRPDLTIADVGYDGPIRQQSLPTLPNGLPYAVVSQPAAGARPAVIPDAAKYTVTIKLSNGAADLFGPSGVTLTLADVALSRLTIDPQISGTGSARPILRRDGTVVATASAAIPATTGLSLTITVTAPPGGTSYSRTFTRGADRFIAIGLDANQFSESLLVRKRGIANIQQINQANGVPVDPERAIGGLLDLAIAQYFTAANADEASLAALTSAVPDRTLVALGIATSGPSLTPVTLASGETLRLQFPYLPTDMGVDVPANVSGGFAIDASSSAIDLTRNLLLGYTNSSLEGLVLEELTNFESVSTMKAFQLAAGAAGGLSNLVEINAANVGSIATLLPGVRADIRNAIAATVTRGLSGVKDYEGVTFTALVPTAELVVGGGTDTTMQWKGVGYTLTCVTSDPSKAHLNGKTVGYIIHGAVGNNPLVSYGGAASRFAVKPAYIKATPVASTDATSAGDPVNVTNGNVYHEEADVEIPALGAPLTFRRRYDSIHTVSGLAGALAAWSDRGMGEGWSFTYSDRIEVTAGEVWLPNLTWFTDQGLRIELTPARWRPPMAPLPEGSYYMAPAGVFGSLTGSASSGFTWRDFDGNTTSFGPAVGGFCPLVSKSDRFGNGVRIDYVAGTTRIARVSDLRDATRWLSFSYNADARPHVSSISDFTGRTWAYSYTAEGRLQTVTAPVPTAGLAAPVIRYAYYADAARRGLLASVTDPAGNATSWEYYTNRRGFRVTDTEGLRHSFIYNLHRRQSAFIDERGNASRYSYDEQGNLLELQQPDRTTERSAWDGRGLKLSSTDAYGATTLYAYDVGTGKVTSVTDPSGNVTTTTYTTGTFRDVDTITRQNRPNDASDDVVTRFTYDASGFLTSRIDDLGPGRLNATTRYTATPNGRGLVRTQTTPNGTVTAFAYNSAGQLTTRADSTNAGGLRAEYFDNSDLTALIGERVDAVIDFEWGGGAPLPSLGADTFSVRWMGQIEAPVTGTYTFTTLSDDGVRVWVNGRPLIDNWTAHPPTENSGSISLEAGRRYDIRVDYYDHVGGATLKLFWTPPGLARQIVPADRLYPRVITDSFTYDSRGNVLSQTDGNGNVTSFTFDALVRKTAETSADPDGTGPLPALGVTSAYDASGNLTSTTLGDGRVTRTAYDNRQREIRQMAADGTYTLISYDPIGNKATETDALGRITRYVYDARNRLVATVFPDGTSTRLRVDGGGRIVATLDQAGSTTTTAYDTLGRKTRETLPDPDGSGPLAATVTAWGYDARGNLEFVTPFFLGQSGVAAGDAAWSTHFEYDALGRKTKETQADPDGSGPLARPVTIFSYDANGNLRTLNDPRGFTTTYAYDQFGRKVSETSPDPDGTGPLMPLVKRYVYDLAGNLRFEVAPGGVSQTDVAFTTEHVYDALNRRIRTILPDPDGADGPLPRPVTTQAYDASGRPSALTDALGRVTTTSYRSSDRVMRVIAPDGSFVTRIYDAVGNLVFAVEGLSFEPQGRRTFTTYDALNRPVAVRGPRPDATSATPVTTYAYDVTGNLVQSTDALGRTTWRQYDALGRLTAETSPLGPFSGDPQATSRTEYDSAGRVTATIDELGRRTETVYDSLGRKIREIGPDAGQGRPVTHYGYDAAGNLRFTTDPRGTDAGDPGFTTYSFYDALGRKTATVDALGADWPVTALPDALPATVTTNVTRTAYDARGRVAATIDALGQTTDYASDNLGRRISATAPDPDGAGPLARPVTRFTYDAVGNRTSVIDPLGNTSVSAYDALDRRTTVTDARGFSTVTTYDLAGNVTSLTDASGNVTRYAYDRRNRLITETDPLGAVSRYAYDLAGNKLRETDRLGRVTSFVYDAADRLVEERWQASVSAAVFHTINRVYDAAGQLLGVTETDTVTPAATTAWQFTYDAAGNVVKSRMAPGELAQEPVSWSGSLAAGDATIDWDGDGRTEQADAITSISVLPGDSIEIVVTATGLTPAILLFRGSNPGTFTGYEAGAGRLVARRTADTADTWSFAVTTRDELATGTYDIRIVTNGNSIVSTALVEYDFAFDKAGILLTATEDHTAIAQFGSFGPAASGLGVRTSFTVDALNRVTRYEEGVPGAAVSKRVDYAYRADGSVGSVNRFAGAGTNPIGTSTATYDGMGRLTGITHAPTASPAISYGYAYDAASRITSLTTPEGTSTFALDATDQLLSASLTGEAYAYDKTGNRTSSGTQTGQGNRLAFDGTSRYAYDAEGNRTAKFVDVDNSGTLSTGDTDVTVYGYDQRNRLVTVSHVNAWTSTQAAALPAFTATGAGMPDSDLELRSTYDYADRRIRRSIDPDGQAGAGAESVSFAGYAGNLRTLEIARPNEAIVIDSLRGPIGFLGQVVQRNFSGNGVDEILAVDQVSWNTGTPTTSSYWTLTDHQDSVRDIVSGNAGSLGQVVEHRQYDSFGRIVRRTTGPQGGAPATPGVGIDFGYAGRPLEARTGLSDNRARWYEPGTGKFINEDPSGFRGGDANLFRYVGNDPLNQVDPSGLAAKWARQSGKSAVPAAAFAGFIHQGSTTLTNAIASQGKASTDTPTLSLASSNAASANLSKPLPFASLVTTGRAAPQSPVIRAEPIDARAREAAFFADKVYDRAYDNNGALRGGLFKAFGVDYQPPKGFQAALFEGSNKTLILSFRGTEPGKGWETFYDMRADVRQAAGLATEQYAYGIDLTKRTQAAVEKAGYKLLLTGHSLGAGIGAAASHATGCDAELFNPAWLNRKYSQGTPGRIQSHIIIGDPVDEARKFFGAQISGEAIYHARQPGSNSAHSMSNFLK